MSEYFPKSDSADFAPYPMLWLAVCFAFGILTAKFFIFGWHVSLAICMITALLAAVFIKQKAALIFLSVAFVAAGALFFQIENQNIPANRLKRLFDENQIQSGDPIEIEGVLQAKPELAAGGFFLKLKTETAIYKGEERKISGAVRLFAPIQNEQIAAEYEHLNLQYGSRVRVACNLRREDGYSNPGVVSQKEILDQLDIDATAIIKSALLVENLGEARDFAPLAWIFERRQELITNFREKFNVSTAGVLIASLLGDKYFLDKPTAEVFREGGTFHVLVISGLHITFIGGLTLLFVRLFTRKRLWQFLIASALLWSYAIAVGAEVPVVRAAIMFTILLFSQVIYRQGALLNSFGACVLILLVWRPADLFTASFQLTIASVAAIVVMAFPLIQKLRAVGSWSPTVETPFPPNVPVWLKRFCETLYWREAIWKRDLSSQIWTARLFKTPYFNWTEKRNLQKTLCWIFESMLVSTIVQIWLLPFLIIYFHRVSIFGVFLNLWVGVWIALESFAAIIAVIFAQISDSLAFPVIKLTVFLNWLLLSVPMALTGKDWASVRLPHYAGAAQAIYFLYFLPILFFVVALQKWKPFAISSKPQILNLRSKFFAASLFRRTVAAMFFLLFGLIIFHPLSAPRADKKLHFDFLDVGQGDSIFITFPDGETLLVDGGGRMNFNRIYVKNEFDGEPELFEPDTQNIGETVVSAFLWQKGYDKVDYILATHADADHIQGLIDVAKNFRVKTAMFGRTPFKDEDFAELYSVLQKREIEAIKLVRGDVFIFGDAKVEVLSPTPDDEISDNNHSIVLRITYGERKFLLTGDIEKETERELLNAPEFLQADVIKVAHHGSRTSSTEEFIDAVRAQVAVIPVGKQSPFGHPHKEVLERWKMSGAKILTTGERGTISISTDGKDLRIETFVP
ncbi:MAG TPA: DNA internalization-related competence protein ComEC/Rec2 [Pyrinomonadaceae bacterium]|jgi:competence protein ComEC